jgi:hypothetical protein
MPFHQIMRSTSPVFTVLIYRLRYHRTYSTSTYLSLLPIVLGAGLATYGDYYFTVPGFLLTLLGVVLAAVKVAYYSLPYFILTLGLKPDVCWMKDGSNKQANDWAPLPLTSRVPLQNVTSRLPPVCPVRLPERRTLLLQPQSSRKHDLPLL